MAAFMTFVVLIRVAGTRAGPMFRVKYGSGLETGPVSSMVGWASFLSTAVQTLRHIGWNLCPDIDVS